MKKQILFFFAVILLICTMTAGASATDVVYADGVTYTTLLQAAQALPETGGTIVVTGAVVHGDLSADAIELPAKPLVITSVYDGVDYAATKGAYFGVGRTLYLGADTTFEHITIKQTNSTGTYGNIYAQGNHLTIGEGVTTVVNETTGSMTPIFGGYVNNKTADTHITIQSGSWTVVYGGGYTTYKGNSTVEILGGTITDVYGGNRANTFTGNSEIIMTGGTVQNRICGGNLNGNFVGNASVTITGGTVERIGDTSAVCGATFGVSGKSGTFTGNISVSIGGTAEIYPTVYGTGYYANFATNGDVTVDIYGNAKIYRNVYAGGGHGTVTANTDGISLTVRDNVQMAREGASVYICAGTQAGTVNGNLKTTVKDSVHIAGNVYGAGYGGTVNGTSTAEIYGGTVTATFSAGSRGGTVSGNTVVNAYGGKIGYYSASATYGITGNGGNISDTVYGKVTGTATILLDGADVADNITLSGVNGTVTLKSGHAGSISDTVAIDLSAGGALAVGGNVTASDLVGGGSITIPAAGSITTAKMSGEVTLKLDGAPVAKQTYITVNDATSTGTVAYTALEDEVLVKAVGTDSITYTMTYPDRYETTHVRVNYYNPLGTTETQPKIVMVKGLSTESDRVSIELTKDTENGFNYAEADLTAGLHYYKVYYGSGGSDYEMKYFYISGKAESLTFDCPLEPYVADAYMETVYSNQTDEVMAYFGTDGLVGYTEPETFAYHMDRRAFLTNAEVCDYVAKLDAKSEYLHTFYPFAQSAMGNEWPVMVFTKDTVAEGADFDTVAAAICAAGEREILMITGGVHGNEPAGPEGVLYFASELCGEYGAEVLDHFGAIVIMPVVSIDNLQRFKRMTADDINPNRDLMALYLPSSQNQIYVYKSFMPTITIDCHEDNGNLAVDASDYSIENMDDVCIRYSGLQNSPLHNPYALANGTENIPEQTGIGIMLDAIERTRDSGVRSSIYYAATCNPVTSTDYPSTRGSYGFIVETMRIWSGKGRYERAVFAMKEGLKSLVAEFVEADGQLAKDVYENRAKVAAITKFDADRVFATQTTISGNTMVTMPRPSIYVDGTCKDADATKLFSLFDTVSNLRALPTAYVVSAADAEIESILHLLDMHGILYKRLKAGATLTLRAYTGIGSTVTLGDAAEVTFAEGAYVITMDTSDAYLIAYLFEPDSFPFTSAENTTVSLAHMGYITDGDALYRSEVDDMTALIADMVYTELVLGDVSGDGKVDITDVLESLRALLDGKVCMEADMNKDGRFSLVDVLGLLKRIVE